MDQPVTPHTITTQKDADDFFYKTPYFAFLDILGFTALVRKNPHAKLVQLYKDLFSAQVEQVAEEWKKIAQARVDQLGENYTDSNIRMVNISDSILIWTSHGQPSALIEITHAVRTLLGLSLIQGLPLRGSITRQPFSVFEEGSVVSVVGMGLVHAYGQEKKQRWSGCIIDTEIIDYFRDIEQKVFHRNAPSPVEHLGLVYAYDIPVIDKDGNPLIEKGYAVDWSSTGITDEMIRESFDAHGKKDKRPDSTTPDKIQNTLDFHHFCLGKAREKVEAEQVLRDYLDKH